MLGEIYASVAPKRRVLISMHESEQRISVCFLDYTLYASYQIYARRQNGPFLSKWLFLKWFKALARLLTWYKYP